MKILHISLYSLKLCHEMIARELYMLFDLTSESIRSTERCIMTASACVTLYEL